MDTRRKILSPAEARALVGPLTVVTGYFDVLGPEDIRELQAAAASGAERSRLLAVVLPLRDAALSARARAELVAALRMVDYVVAAEENEVDPLMEALRPGSLVRLDAGQTLRKKQFIEYVKRRQND